MKQQQQNSSLKNFSKQSAIHVNQINASIQQSKDGESTQREGGQPAARFSMDNKTSKVNFVAPGGLPPGGAASNLNDSNNYHDNLRPITLEDEDFISNIKESKTLEFVFVKG